MPSPLSPEFPDLLFDGKFSDVAALNRGDAGALRPTVRAEAAANWSSWRTPAAGHALVIGGNGFVGSHLVAHLSVQPGIERVVAVVRAGKEPPHQRFEASLHKYRVTQVDRSKIEVVEGTPTAPGLGLARDVRERLAQSVDLVFNCASSTDYSVGYLDLRPEWVLSLLRVVEFCAVGRPKHLTYLGSMGRYFYQQPADFARPDSWWYSGYAQMKWVNAELLLSLAAQGFPVTLCDTHYVLGSSVEGVDPGRTYSLWRVLELAKTLGVMWEGPGMNYVPVDVLVGSVTANCLAPTPLARILPRNVQPYRTSVWADGLGTEVVPLEDFMTEVRLRAPRVVDSLLSSDVNDLVDTINRPEPVFPESYSFAWPTHEALFDLYFSKLGFQHLRWVRPRPQVADLTAVERAVLPAG